MICKCCQKNVKEERITPYKSYKGVIALCPDCLESMKWTTSCIVSTTEEIKRYGKTAYNRIKGV